jgi:hypothetical protein
LKHCCYLFNGKNFHFFALSVQFLISIPSFLAGFTGLPVLTLSNCDFPEPVCRRHPVLPALPVDGISPV